MSTSVPPLTAFLAEIPEFRKARGKRYALLALLLYVCVAMLCGRRSQAAIAEWGKDYGQPWLAHLGLRRGKSPSQPTIHRLFKGISREQVEHALCRWALDVLHHLAPGEESQLLSALSQRLNIVLGQVAVPDATNETGALDQLLDLIGIAGYVTTTDALHTQRDIAQAIVDGHGDYLQVVKENQPGLLEDIQTLFEQPQAVQKTFHAAHSTNLHGDRIEERHLVASAALVGYTDWPGLHQVMKLERCTRNKQQHVLHHEIVYGVTSLSPDRASPAQLLKLWREHWHIENKLHYVRDVTFDEDRSQVRAEHIPQVMAAFRNATISLFRLLGWTNIAAACRRFAAQPQLALAAVGVIT